MPRKRKKKKEVVGEKKPKKTTKPKIKPEYIFGAIVVIAAVAGAFLFAPQSQKGPYALVIVDPSCVECMQSFDRILNSLKANFSDLNSFTFEYVNPNSSKALEVLKSVKENRDVNIMFIPLIAFKGIEDTNFYKTLSRYFFEAGEYKVLAPAWVFRNYDPSKGEVYAELSANELFSNIKYYLYRAIPNLVITENPPSGHALDLKIPKDYSSIVEQLLSGLNYEKKEGAGTVEYTISSVTFELKASEPLLNVLKGYISQNIPNADFSTSSDTEHAFEVIYPPEYSEKMREIFTRAVFEGNRLYYPKKDEINVDLFVMSFCPYGNIAEGVAKNLKEKFGEKVHIIPHYIIYTGESCAYYGEVEVNGQTVCSMHGIPEFNQDVREYCIYELYGEDFWLEYVNWVNNNCNSHNVDTCWTGYDLNVQKVEDCFEKEYERIVFENISASEEKKVTGSPTTFVEGILKYDIRSPDFGDVVCAFLKNPPSDCSSTVKTQAPSGGCGG